MNCSKCSVELKPVFPLENYLKRRNDYPQYADALVLELNGGYGMYFDSGVERLILCKSCAAEFFVMNNWIDRSFL